MEKEDRNQKIFALVILIALIAVLVYNIINSTKGKDEEVIDTKTISIVKDNSRFYTVSSCVSKYLTYLTSNNTDSLLVLLSDEYKDKYNINSSNIYSYIKTSSNLQEFQPKKMFEQHLSKSVYKYYVYGTIRKDVINSKETSEDYYLIVILDEQNMSFSVEPYDGEIFN